MRPLLFCGSVMGEPGNRMNALIGPAVEGLGYEFVGADSVTVTRRGQNDNPVNVSMSRTDIGDYLGLTTETVSRTFTQLKGAGLISLRPGGKVHLADTETLTDIAEGL